MKVCSVGAPEKLGQHMVQHALHRGYDVAGVYRAERGTLDGFKAQIAVFQARRTVERSSSGLWRVLTVLVPRGVHNDALGTARAVLDHAAPGAGSCSPAAGISSDTRWTLVPGSGLEESESQGLPVWRRQVGDPMLESNITRRVDFAWFMVAAPEHDEVIDEARAIVGCQTPSTLAHGSFAFA